MASRSNRVTVPIGVRIRPASGGAQRSPQSGTTGVPLPVGFRFSTYAGRKKRDNHAALRSRFCSVLLLRERD